MSTKTHYQTDLDNLYTGPIECPPDPHEEGKWWVPFGAYPDAPPPKGEHQVQKRVGAAWELVPDYRGYVYWSTDRERFVIQVAGITPPVGHLTEDPGPTPAQIAAALKREAQALLDKSDQTVGRCYENGVAVPELWRTYRADLRAIVTSGSGSLPERPDYPEGTG